MTDYNKLVAALRGCKDIEFCTECPRMGNGFTEYCNIKEDAADAIEALQAEVERYKTAWAVEREDRLGIEPPKEGARE